MRGLLLLVGVLPLLAARGEVRFVAAGWDWGNQTLAELARQADEIAQLPLDGIRFVTRAYEAGGRAVAGPTKAMDGVTWAFGAFDGELDDARRLTSLANMRHSFVGVRSSPNRRLDWRDDAAWASFATNLAVLARFARDAGAKGLCPDFEDYVHVHQYQLQDDDPDWRETQALARRRGRETFGAAFAEYPEMTLFLWHFVNPWKPDFETCDDVTEIVRSGHDLHYAFYNGILDALPPAGHLAVCEEQLYDRRAETGDFYRGAALERKFDPALLAPANRVKFRNQATIGFDLYLDAFRADNAKSPYYRGKGTHPTFTANFLANLEQATKASEEYVWFWGEARPWVTWRRANWRGKPTWNEELPGLHEGLRRIRDPKAYARQKLAACRASGASNLVANAACETTAEYVLWQRVENSNATFRVDRARGCRAPGALCVTGVKGAVTVGVHGLRPGDRYLFAACGQVEGDGAISATVAWQKDRKWDFTLTRRRLERAPADAAGWILFTGMAVVPDGANGLGLSLGSELRPDQRAWFDDVEIYRIP